MAKDVNLNSTDWCDLVFEGKNKAYGAYKMRRTSSKRHVVAFIVMVLFAVFMAVLPIILAKVRELTKQRETMTEVTNLSDLKLEDQVKEENIIRQEVAPPPPPLKSSIKFTELVITTEDIPEGEELKSQEDLATSKVAISVADVIGTDEKEGKDIADLAGHKVIVEEKPLIGVEQMPEFPGGEEELIKFIKSNLRYPQIAADNGIGGRVTLRFVVSKTGEVSGIEVIRGLDPSCDKEAIRVVKMMPRWIPGRQNGRNVPVYFTLPVLFKLQN
jgi:periplasmic protein TonB